MYRWHPAKLQASVTVTSFSLSVGVNASAVLAYVYSADVRPKNKKFGIYPYASEVIFLPYSN